MAFCPSDPQLIPPQKFPEGKRLSSVVLLHVGEGHSRKLIQLKLPRNDIELEELEARPLLKGF